MGDEASVANFAPDDFFLRRTSRKRDARQGIVGASAFDDPHPTLSLTLRDGELQTPGGLAQYQHSKVLPSGDLPGIVGLSFYDLTESVTPPLPPRRDPVPTDEEYGHLHCCTDRPRNQNHRDQLAKLATRHGVLLSLVPAKKRSGHPPS